MQIKIITDGKQYTQKISDLLPLFPKVRFSRVCTLIKNLINVYNLIYFLFYYTLSNNFLPRKFNQFKYSQLMFFKSIKKYFNNIKIYLYGIRKKSKKSYFREQREYKVFPTENFSLYKQLKVLN